MRKVEDARYADFNGSYDNWWSTNGLGLVWYENP
jgi:hypothetical protein